MTRLGITGHQNLPADAIPWITSDFLSILDEAGTGAVVSSLAEGADQLLSTLAVEHDFDLEVVIPCSGYETTLSATGLAQCRSLLDAATSVTTLDFPEPSEAAYMAAGKVIADNCELLCAVWDGRPAKGLGGTGDVVDYARTRGRLVRIIWPEGALRE